MPTASPSPMPIDARPSARANTCSESSRHVSESLVSSSLGQLARGPAVDAIPGEVQLAPGEPGRPLGTPGRVDHVLPRLRELEPQILDDRRPEPLRLLDREVMEV